MTRHALALALALAFALLKEETKLDETRRATLSLLLSPGRRDETTRDVTRHALALALALALSYKLR